MRGRAWLLISLALAASAPAGCGMAARRLDAESLAAATTAVRPFREPPHRVAMAAFEVMRSELASADFAGDAEFAPAPKPRDGDLPPDFPAFRLEWSDRGKPAKALVMLRAIKFAGKAKDGRPVEVGVDSRSGETLATIRVDQLGDRMFANDLFDRIADRLAHPPIAPGSPEEAEAFQAFFGGEQSRRSAR